MASLRMGKWTISGYDEFSHRETRNTENGLIYEMILGYRGEDFAQIKYDVSTEALNLYSIGKGAVFQLTSSTEISVVCTWPDEGKRDFFGHVKEK